MEREFDAYKWSRNMYLSIFNNFPVIRTASAKIAIFTYRSPHFCFPWRRPCDYHAICYMDEKTIQCLPKPRSMYLSIFNSFRVIRCLSQCVSPKIAIEDIFIRFDVSHERDRQTDRRTLDDRKDRACIASRGKNYKIRDNTGA